MDGALLRRLVEGERRRLGWARWVLPAAVVAWCGFLALAACLPGRLATRVLGTGWQDWALYLHAAWIALVPAIVLAPCWAEERQRGTIEGLMLTTAPVEALVRIKLEARLLPWIVVLPLGGIPLAVLASPSRTGFDLADRSLAYVVWCAGACTLSAASAALGSSERYGWFGCALLSLLTLYVLELVSMLGFGLLGLVSSLMPVVIRFEALALLHGIVQVVLARYAFRQSVAVVRAHFEYPTG